MPPGTSADHPVWEDIEATRAEGRVGVRDLLRYGATGTLRLRGTDEGERDDSVLIALTRLDGQPCVLVGQDRSRQRVGALSLLADGDVHHVIPEPPEDTTEALARAVAAEVAVRLSESRAERRVW